MHNPDFGIAVEGARAAYAEHLLATLEPPNASRTAKGWLGQLGWAFSNQRSPTGLYGLANGSRFSVRNLSFGVGSPQQASGFIQRRSRARSGCSSVELIGEHRSPFRDPHARHASFQAKH
jgi:hypothetical protein